MFSGAKSGANGAESSRKNSLLPTRFPVRVAKTWAAFDELLASRNLSGCAIFIDELSLFMGGREHHLLQRDAAWLQFLGQRARRQNQRPVWVFGALQKTVEDIGDVDAYAVSQIRDRFVTLPLALAHLPSLIARRLVQKKDEAKLARVCDESYVALSRALPRLDFGRDEWHTLYPFHPATVALLEQIAPRYFSRTRSAALFCRTLSTRIRPASQRVLPPQLFDDIEAELPLASRFEADLPSHGRNGKPPETMSLATQPKPGICARSGKRLRCGKSPEPRRQLRKSSTVWRSMRNFPAMVRMSYGRILLERLRAHAPVALERRDGEFADRYALDFGARTGELARRFTANALANLAPRDGRVAHFVLSCSRDEALPVASLDGTTALPFWRNAARRVEISVASLPLAPYILANRIAALQQAGGSDALLFLAPPFGDNAEAMNGARRCAKRLQHWKARNAGAARLRGGCRASHRTTNGSRCAKRRRSILLLSDPQLADNRRGRAVLEHCARARPNAKPQSGALACACCSKARFLAARARSLMAANSRQATATGMRL
jgi:hypothetical protein